MLAPPFTPTAPWQVFHRFALAPQMAEYVVVLEGKGPRDPLDRPFAGRKQSALEQALHYAVNLGCWWYLVTNLRRSRCS